MNSIAYEKIADRIEEVSGSPVKRTSRGFSCACPAHGGKNKNLHIRDGEGRVIMRCFSQGCDPKDILESIGLSIKDVYHNPISGKELSRYNDIKKSKIMKEELSTEMLIIQAFLSAYDRNDCEEIERDRERIHLAIDNVHAATRSANLLLPASTN